MAAKRTRTGRAIARRLQSRPQRPAAARLIRQLQQRPEHLQSLACGYGVHPFEMDKPEPGYKRCPAWGATYLVDFAAVSPHTD